MRANLPAPALALLLAACAEPPPPPAAPPPPPPAPVAPAPPPPPEPAAVAPAAPTAAPAPPAPPPSPCPAGMALVPGGKYTTGHPKHEATIPALCMDLTETTADDYAACVKAGKCSDTNLKCSPQATYQAAGMGDHPVVCVDFAQANAYCAAQNKRLPSDEEWEWAARGGPAATTFPWGNDKANGKVCWSGETALTGTCAVGATPSGDNPQGIHDLAGNVFEWTTSRYDKAGPMRVGRGGSWRDAGPEGIKVTRTGPGFLATYRCGFLGIRCVAEPKP